MSLPPKQTSEHTSHRGHCHCGAVRFSFTLSPPLHEYPAVTCNCSICSKNGYLLVYPFQKDFTIESGQDVLKKYMFGNHKAEHKFCGECGSSCFIRPLDLEPAILAVNVRMLQDFDYDKLKLTKVDGRSRAPEYKV